MTKGETHVVKELSTGITLNVVCIKVTPSQLNVDPVFVAGSSVQDIFHLIIKGLGTNKKSIRLTSYVSH
jgi:hypothetical protein